MCCKDAQLCVFTASGNLAPPLQEVEGRFLSLLHHATLALLHHSTTLLHHTAALLHHHVF